MMRQSLEEWSALEDDAGEKLKHETGLLCVTNKAPSETSLTDMQRLLERRNVQYEPLTPAEVSKRFPQFRLAPEERALYAEGGGVLFASKCVEACWRVIIRLGGATLAGDAVTKIEKIAGAYLLKTAKGTLLRAKAVVCAPGPWLSSFAETFFDLSIHTTVTAETVSYFAPRPSETGVDHSMFRMPAFIVDEDNGLGKHGFYGLPIIDVRGVKLSAHFDGFPIEDMAQRPQAAGGTFPCSPALETQAEEHCKKIIESNSALSKQLFPHIEDRPLKSETCLYTSTRDHDFIIDHVPGWENVVMIGGGSGHGFKFAPAVGEAAGCLVTGDELPFSLAKFRINRAALHKE